MVYEFISLGNIKGFHDETAPRIERKKERAKKFGVHVREIFYSNGKRLVDYDERTNYSPSLVIFFEAPDDKTAMRFAKSLYPDVKGQTILDVTRKPMRIISVTSEEEARSILGRIHPK